MSWGSDLASSFDEELLLALITYIETRSAEAKESAVSILSKYLVVAYELGAERAAKEVSVTAPISLAGLDPVLDRLAPTLDETFGSLAGELTGTVEKGIRNHWTYAKTREELAAQIKAGWGKSITFDRVGQTRRIAWVNPDGTLEWRTKTISHSITLPADTYAETLARTNVKAAYANGRLQRYAEAEREGWVYLAVADERTRPHHLALHGRVFKFGTEAERMAREALQEPNCRCDMIVWWNDPKLDTDPAVYEQQRKDWAANILPQYPDGSPWAKFLQEVATA